MYGKVGSLRRAEAINAGIIFITAEAININAGGIFIIAEAIYVIAGAINITSGGIFITAGAIYVIAGSINTTVGGVFINLGVIYVNGEGRYIVATVFFSLWNCIICSPSGARLQRVPTYLWKLNKAFATRLS